LAPSIRKKLAVTSPTSGGLSVGVVRSRTQTMGFFNVFFLKKLFTIFFNVEYGAVGSNPNGKK
jgi:hypothetical protein